MTTTTKTAATTVAACVHSIVASYVTGQRNTTAAGIAAMIDFAKTLEGISAITDATWKADYQEGVTEGVKASGVVSEASLPMTVSKLKTAAQGVTHGISFEGRTFSAYVVHCREDEARAIMGKAPKATGETLDGGAERVASAPSATADPSTFMADAFEDTLKGRKEAKALSEQLGGAEMAMGLMIVCDGSVSLAKLTHAVLTSREAEFRQWAGTLLTEAPKATRRTLKD